MTRTTATPKATPMTTPTTSQYAISWDPEVELFLVLDANLDHVADGETRAEAEQELARLMADDLRAEIERKIWDGGVSLETLKAIRAMLGE